MSSSSEITFLPPGPVVLRPAAAGALDAFAGCDVVEDGAAGGAATARAGAAATANDRMKRRTTGACARLEPESGRAAAERREWSTIGLYSDRRREFHRRVGWAS